nr:MAG TPA: chitin synthase regulator [Caudoviricetes sp.]
MSKRSRITSSSPRRGLCVMIGSLIGLLIICSQSRRRRRPGFCGRLS